MRENNVKWLLGLTLTGIGCNFIPAPFLSDGETLFGLPVAVLIALMYSPRYAMPAMTAIFVPVFLFNVLTLPLLLLAGLPAAMSLLCHQKSLFFPLKLGGSYSVLIVPLLLLYYQHDIAGLTLMATTAATVTFLCALTSVLIGHLSSLFVQMYYFPKSMSRHINFRQLLGYCFSALFFLSVLTVSYAFIHQYQSRQKSQLDLYMKQRVFVLSEQVQSFLAEHQGAINLVANGLSQLPQPVQQHQASTQQMLTTLALSNPEFLTFLTADNKGEITHAWPDNLMAAAKSVGMTNVAYRPYFSEVMATGKPYFSDAFEGKGFGNDPILAMSSPVSDSNGNTIGIIEGSLSLKAFSRFDVQNIGGFRMVVEDSAGNTVYASTPLQLETLAPFRFTTCTQGECAGLVQFDGRQWLAESAIVKPFDWTIRFFFDYKNFLALTNASVVTVLELLVVLGVVGLLAGYALSSFLGRPIRHLISQLEAFNLKERKWVTSNQHMLPIDEISALEGAFSSLQRRLAGAFDELDNARSEEHRLNSRLNAMNLSLETRIQEKTKSLAHALTEAKAASVAKSQFLANMSHEIRTPMNGIIGSCENLMSEEVSPVTAKRISLISQSASNLLMILDSILDWSKIEAGKMQLDETIFSLSDLVESSYFLHKNAAQTKGIGCEFVKNTPIPPAVVGDMGKLSQILNNLLSNAIKFTPKGEVTVEISYENGLFTMHISDSGVGIPADKLATIFEQFAQADTSTTRLFGGTGLGLAITQKLADLMGGSVSVDSDVGKGTVFTVVLPFPEAEAVTETIEHVLPELPEELRVLVVEDNDINAEIVMDMLRTKKVKCIRTANGAEAVAAVQQMDFHLVLMDCQMPVMDGFEATRLIRTLEGERATIPVIALTANAFADDQNACYDAGMNDYLSKPVRRIELFKKLYSVYHRHYTVS